MQQTKKNLRFVLKCCVSLGIGLFMAGIWWQYSDKLLNLVLPLIGL